MPARIVRIVLMLLLYSYPAIALEKNITIEMEWHRNTANGTIDVTNGTLKAIQIIKGKGSVKQNRFDVRTKECIRLRL